MLKNRLEKNYRKLKPWVERIGTDAFRLYDRDIPEFPFIIDFFKDFIVLYDRTEKIDEGKNKLSQALEALHALFPSFKDQIVIKTRERQSGKSQYQKLDSQQCNLIVTEKPAIFEVNLSDYLDTGLFLDHRPLRNKVFKESKGKKVLNLFCYTGSFSVMAALGGASHVTSVDMSATYLNWAKRNFELNQISPRAHDFVQADVINYLQELNPHPSYDLIVLDPPTFSNSKRMDDEFEVERDQRFLVESCMRLLKAEGVLYFSNNKRKFQIDPLITEKFNLRDITKTTIPNDFHDQKIHVCFELRHKS